MDDYCSVNPARMALMQTEAREPLAASVVRRERDCGGRYRGGARQAGGSRRNNGRGRSVMGASGENGKALGKIRNFGSRLSDEDVTPVTAAPVIPPHTNIPILATNGIGQKRKRDGENGVAQEETSRIILRSNGSDKKRRKPEEDKEPRKETKDKKAQISESNPTTSNEIKVDKSVPKSSMGEKKAEKALKKASKKAMEEAAKGSIKAPKKEYTSDKKDRKSKEKIKSQSPETDESSASNKEKKEKKERKERKEKQRKEKKERRERKEKKNEENEKKAKSDKKKNKDKKLSKPEIECPEEVPITKKRKSSASKEDITCTEGSKGSKEPSLRWNAAELSGGDTRQSKFLRLLGAGGTDDIAVAAKPSGAASLIKQREQELEKQFNAGLKMNKLDGKRKGLGA